eukprot:6461301-Amphidinium_carterae.1
MWAALRRTLGAQCLEAISCNPEALPAQCPHCERIRPAVVHALATIMPLHNTQHDVLLLERKLSKVRAAMGTQYSAVGTCAYLRGGAAAGDFFFSLSLRRIFDSCRFSRLSISMRARVRWVRVCAWGVSFDGDGVLAFTLDSHCAPMYLP